MARDVRYPAPHRRSRLPHRDRPTQPAPRGFEPDSAGKQIGRPSPCASTKSGFRTQGILAASPSRRTDEGATSAVSSARLPRQPNSHSWEPGSWLACSFYQLSGQHGPCPGGPGKPRGAGFSHPLAPCARPGPAGPLGSLPAPLLSRAESDLLRRSRFHRSGNVVSGQKSRPDHGNHWAGWVLFGRVLAVEGVSASFRFRRD